MTTYQRQTELIVTVVGGFDLFPTWNPRYGPLFVGNIEHLFTEVGVGLPTPIWMKLEPGVDVDQIRGDLGQLNPFSTIQQPHYQSVILEQQRPERQGLFGILSMGFISMALLAAIGFFLYTVFSLRRRVVELGVLQAMGLSFWQTISYLAWEFFSLMLIALAGGTWLGMTVSKLWVPHFNVGTEITQVLPLSLRFGWSSVLGVYLLFGLLLGVVLGASLITSRRLEMFEAIKRMNTV